MEESLTPGYELVIDNIQFHADVCQTSVNKTSKEVIVDGSQRAKISSSKLCGGNIQMYDIERLQEMNS